MLISDVSKVHVCLCFFIYREVSANDIVGLCEGKWIKIAECAYEIWNIIGPLISIGECATGNLRTCFFLLKDVVLSIYNAIKDHSDSKNLIETASNLYSLIDLDHQFLNDWWFCIDKIWPILFCGADNDIPNSLLTEARKTHLKTILQHSRPSPNGNRRESGVIRTANGDTVAVGHVITGLYCGGLERNQNVWIANFIKGVSYNVDTLFVGTLGGDLALTLIRNSTGDHLLGPGGNWDSQACPTEYTLNDNPSEVTDAEILADIDGIILSLIIPDIVHKDLRLTDILRDYYGKGLGRGYIFKNTNRITNFKMAVQDVELTKNTISAIEFYGDKSMRAKVPSLVKQLYKDQLKECTPDVTNKYTVDTFIKYVEIAETATGYEIENMAQEIVGLIKKKNRKLYFGLYFNVNLFGRTSNDGFAWKVLSDLVTHELINVGLNPPDKMREIGILQDSEGHPIAIANVLAGIIAEKRGLGKIFTKADNLYGTTVAGALAHAALQQESKIKKSGLFGVKGQWSDDCPPGYSVDRKDKLDYKITHAEMLGAIDGFILGNLDSDLQLSKVIKQYYGSGLISDPKIQSKQRKSLNKDNFGNTEKLLEETKDACVDLQSRYFPEMKRADCKALATEAVKSFESNFLDGQLGEKI